MSMLPFDQNCPSWLWYLWQEVLEARELLVLAPTEANRLALISAWNTYAIAIGLPLAYNHQPGDLVHHSPIAPAPSPQLPIDSLINTRGGLRNPQPPRSSI
jgi:hypothetical protein